ncbi:MAG TPA: HlyD family efflux transporter periplasmic adaptor subunit [Polyangiaceae bacterium]|nr:HlyD family efflux transporter periplasmic adaptor subunit [Polyangiaceae bacterium]
MANASRIFREQAARAAGARPEGDLLRIAPRWTGRAYGLLIAAFAAGAAFCALGTLHEYAAGPAVVWVAGRVQVTALTSGTVDAVEVRPGQRVEAGQPLVRLASVVEAAELARVDREFELQLAKALRDPSDQAARAALTALRTQRDVASARLEQLTVRAPGAGVVGDVRIWPGQLLRAGDVALALEGEGRRCGVLAMLPAHYRPQVHPGMSLRFEVTGYRYAYQDMTVTAVGAQIIGPGEVKRFLGQEIEDTLKLEGPVVLVEAAPSSPTFTVDGRSFEFHHGMNGVAEARVRTESILVSLWPGLRAVFGGGHG